MTNASPIFGDTEKARAKAWFESLRDELCGRLRPSNGTVDRPTTASSPKPLP